LQHKGCASFLTAKPSQEQGFYLNRQEFQDAIAFRYNWQIQNFPVRCQCGEKNSLDHALCCKLGGFVHRRHNIIRDLEAEFLQEVAYDVQIEPKLLPINDAERLAKVNNTQDQARLDVSCRGFWGPMQRSFYDVRITHLNAPSNRTKPIASILRSNEEEKKRAYNERVVEVEHGSLTPLVFATNGTMSIECKKFHKTLADKLSHKLHQSYSDTISFIRLKLSFAILKSAIVSLRGNRQSAKRAFSQTPIAETDFNLI
jgi:hypothetical protein